MAPADIVFTIQTKAHDRFSRDGDDLIHVCNVTLSEALSGVSKTVKSLDDRVINISAPYVTPDTVKIIPGEGMFNKKKRTRGDLRVKFHIVFPESLGTNAELRNQLGQLLRGVK